MSDDKLQNLLSAGDVQKSQYKLIYQSEVIPRTTIGWFYNLKPELADKFRGDPRLQAGGNGGGGGRHLGFRRFG